MESQLNLAWWWFLYFGTRYENVAKMMTLRCLNKALPFADTTQVKQIHLLIKAI